MQERFLRTACVQLSPCFKDWEASRRRADALLVDLDAGTFDLLVLPEMAFTGYCFQSKEDVDPFAEPVGRGRTFDWAASAAQSLGCYVVIGLPTRDADDEAEVTPPTERTYRNSVIVVSPEGSLVHVYHKTFLYGELTNDRADYLWATAGTGFAAVDLPFPPSSPCRNSTSNGTTPATFRLVPAICMDLNMPTFDSPFDAFELGTFASEHDADLVVGSMSWLDSEPPTSDTEGTDGSIEGAGSLSEWEQVRQVLSYWVLRLSPLIGSGAAFICANRVGREGEVVFTGSSCAIELGDRPTVIEHAGKRTERIVIARVSLPDRRETLD